MSNTNKGTALVTGASSGLGAIYADRLAHRGYNLILVARDADRLATLANRLRAATGRAVDILPADLADAAQLTKVVNRLETDAAITLLVNNAGISLNGSLLENGADQLTRIIAVNITAPTLLAAAAGRAFVARRAGTIINISSVLALVPDMFDGVYSGTKSYLLNLTLNLAPKVRDAGVHVQAVLPGATRTEIWERSGKDVDALLPGQVMEAADLVDAALVGLDRGEVVTIPPLADENQWIAYHNARLAMAPNLSRRDVAERYRNKLAA